MISFMGLTDDVAKEGDALSRTKSTQGNSHAHGNGLGGKKRKNSAKQNDDKDFVFDSPFPDNIPMIIDVIQDERGDKWEGLSTSQTFTKKKSLRKRKKKKKSRHRHYDKLKTLKDFDDENLLTRLTDNANKKTESLEARIKMKASEAKCTKQAANVAANSNNLNDEEKTRDTDEESYGRQGNNSPRTFTFDSDAKNIVDLKDVSKDAFDEAYAKRFSDKETDDSLIDSHAASSRMTDGERKVKASCKFDNDKGTENSIDDIKDDSDFVAEMNIMEIDSQKDETEEADGEKNALETLDEKEMRGTKTSIDDLKDDSDFVAEMNIMEIDSQDDETEEADGEKNAEETIDEKEMAGARQAAQEQGNEVNTSTNAQIYTEIQFESGAKDEGNTKIQSNYALDDEADTKHANEPKYEEDEIVGIPAVEANTS